MTTTITNGNPPDADALLKSTGNPTAQLAYEQVKSDSSNWSNTDYLGADIFTDIDGEKNTVDTTSSTAFYNTTEDGYQLGVDDEASGDTTNDPDSFTNPGNAFDGDFDTYAEKTGDGDTALGKTFGSKSVNIVRTKLTAAANPSNFLRAYLQTYNGSVWADDTLLAEATSGGATSLAISYDDQYVLTATTQGIRIRFESNNTTNHRLYELRYGDYNASDTVETDTIINEIIPDSIVVYPKVALPTDTSITVDVSDDGGTTFPITAQAFNEAIYTSDFTVGNLALRFNLATTDETVTPKLFGYGLAITDTE